MPLFVQRLQITSFPHLGVPRRQVGLAAALQDFGARGIAQRHGGASTISFTGNPMRPMAHYANRVELRSEVDWIPLT